MNQVDPRTPVVREPLYPDEPKSLAELFYYAKKRYNRPDALNYRDKDGWKPISSDEFIGRAESIALGLKELGVERGDRVALLAANSPEWTITDAACQISGVIDVPIYTTLVPASVAYILKDSGSKVLFLENGESYKRLEDAIGECEEVGKIVFFEEPNESVPNSLTLEELIEIGAKLDSTEISDGISAIGLEDVATLIYTSGTTGEPKGVMLTHGNILSNVIDCGEHFGFSSDDVPLSVLPLSHVFERTGMYLYILSGMAIHYAESIEKVADNLQEVRPTIFVGVPRIFEKVYARAKLTAANASPFREKMFDWAIEVGVEHAGTEAAREEISAALALKHKVADAVVFSKAARILRRPASVLYYRRCRTFRFDLSDFYRRRYFDYAGLRPDRDISRYFYK